jgi:hypothetical protein
MISAIHLQDFTTIGESARVKSPEETTGAKNAVVSWRLQGGCPPPAGGFFFRGGRDAIKSGLFDGDGAGFTDLDTAFTSKAFFSIYGIGLAVYNFKNFHGTNIDALFAAFALVCVNDGIKSH